MTLQDRLIQGLLRLGYKEVHPPRQGRKYRIFAPPPIALWKSLVFVGKNGALRRGKSGSASIACPESFRMQVLSTQPDDIGF